MKLALIIVSFTIAAADQSKKVFHYPETVKSIEMTDNGKGLLYCP